MDVTIDLKQARHELQKVKSRFGKLQRTTMGDALDVAAVPTVATAKSRAPEGETGKLRQRIQFVPWHKDKKRPGFLTTEVGPVKFRKNEKGFPFWGLFQERGWRAMGRANRKTFKKYRQIAGKHFLRKAGEQNFNLMMDIYAKRVFGDLAEIQRAGETAGIV